MTVSERLVESVGGAAPYGFSFKSSVGASGGLITVWDSSRVDVWSPMSLGHALIIKGKVISSSE